MTAATSTETSKKKKPAKVAAASTASAAEGAAQTDGVATAQDVALAAGLPATARAVTSDVSLNVVNLLRDTKLVASMRANASLIDAQGRGTVEDTLSRIPDFVARYDALNRLLVSEGRVRDSLTRDNADFSAFATAAVTVFKNAGPLSPLKKDNALKKLAKNRDIQRGLPKMVKTRKAKARAKKAAATKTS
jgi:hypothetical protein